MLVTETHTDCCAVLLFQIHLKETFEINSVIVPDCGSLAPSSDTHVLSYYHITCT